MSKVSLKNELLPSFEPIQQQKTSTQKRKRTLRDTTPKNSESSASHKRSRAKKNTPTPVPTVAIAKSVVWIGATVMQRVDQDENIPSSISAAYSVYYGLNDGRNFTEKITIKENQGLDYVYIMGAIRALEKCEDDSTTLSIHMDSQVVQTAIEQHTQGESAICNEIREKIAKRKGITSISYRSSETTGNKDDEYQAALKMATEKLFESEQVQEDAMDIDDQEVDILNSLEIAEEENNNYKEVSATEATNEEIKIEQQTEVIKEEVISTTIVNEETSRSALDQNAPIETVAAPTWASTLNLRNLLDILKAPFTRKP